MVKQANGLASNECTEASNEDTQNMLDQNTTGCIDGRLQIPAFRRWYGGHEIFQVSGGLDSICPTGWDLMGEEK
jgi:hypothetical protein